MLNDQLPNKYDTTLVVVGSGQKNPCLTYVDAVSIGLVCALVAMSDFLVDIAFLMSNTTSDKLIRGVLSLVVYVSGALASI